LLRIDFQGFIGKAEIISTMLCSKAPGSNPGPDLNF